MITVSELDKVSDGSVSEINSLMRQLSSSPENAKQTSRERLETLFADKNVLFLAAKDGEKIVGMGTLIVLPQVHGDDAFIEDVVVDEAYRGQGIATQIVQRLIDEAKKRRVVVLGLTSRPLRVAANKLYQKMGFRLKETNFYNMRLND